MFDRILVAVDSTQASVDAALAATRPLLNEAASYVILHVLEPQAIPYSVDPAMTGALTDDIEQSLRDRARAEIQRLCRANGADAEQLVVAVGRPASQIQHFARDLDCDLIVLASHGAHGWRRVLGSTANAVLHGAPASVLIARLPDSDHRLANEKT